MERDPITKSNKDHKHKETKKETTVAEIIEKGKQGDISASQDMMVSNLTQYQQMYEIQRAHLSKAQNQK